MKLGALFSGGKDSAYAMFKAMKKHEIACLITLISKNDESYMFHVPNIHLTEMQAEAIGLPLLKETTEGIKEEELKDLKRALQRAKDEYGIEGITTGALASNYQRERIAKLCEELGLECVNPLWGMDPEKLMNELLDSEFEIIIVSVAAEGLGREWLGKKIDSDSLEKLKELSKKHLFHLVFEGGEAETLVIDAPIFKKRLEIISADKIWNKNSGIYKIKDIKLVDK